MKGYLGPGPGTHVCFNFSIASVWIAGGVWKAWAWNQCTYFNFPLFQYEVEEEYERPRTSVPTDFNFPLLQYEVEEEYERLETHVKLTIYSKETSLVAQSQENLKKNRYKVPSYSYILKNPSVLVLPGNVYRCSWPVVRKLYKLTFMKRRIWHGGVIITPLYVIVSREKSTW